MGAAAGEETVHVGRPWEASPKKMRGSSSRLIWSGKGGAGAYTEVEPLAPSPARGGVTGEDGAQIHRRPFAGWRWRSDSSPSLSGLAVVPGSIADSAREGLWPPWIRCWRGWAAREGRGRHGSGVGESWAAREGRGRNGSGVGESWAAREGRGHHGSSVGESCAAREGQWRCEVGWGAMAGGGVALVGLRCGKEVEIGRAHV